MTRATRKILLIAMFLLVFAAPLALTAEKETPAQPTARQQSSPNRTETLLELLYQRGWIMIPMTLCSIITLAFVLERLVSLRRRNILSRPFYEEVSGLVKDGQLQLAETACRDSSLPFADILHAVLVGGETRSEMESALENAGARVTWRLRQNGKVFGVIANVSVLLGLLGTVLGMIDAFMAYSNTSGRPEPALLATGIYEALVCTAVGLAIAVPSLLMFHYFRGRADNYVREMEDMGLMLIDDLARAHGGGHAGKGGRLS